ncbi:hypothetical protein, partial [Lacticaseibacillus rhamnosus]|uniref:hypothetical protein n=1 Tax=Lacticaseibacillus rhamnosus TaxID=47715 RepID=UPI001CDCE021
CLAVNTPAIMAHLQSRYSNHQQELALDSTREWVDQSGMEKDNRSDRLEIRRSCFFYRKRKKKLIGEI